MECAAEPSGARLILLTFGLIGNFTARGNTGRALGWLIGSAGFPCGLYQWISDAAGEWRLCSAGKCRTLSEILGHPVGVNVTVMRACGG
jgi:hypothetical protein